jgi:hypothetical protein
VSVAFILLPLFVEVGLTLVLLASTGLLRVGAMRRGEVAEKDVALRQLNWPPRLQKISNAYHNQLELPVLFYVIVILALFTKQADILFVALAWMFVVSRLVHAGIHVTSNAMLPRFAAFVVGFAILAIMWIIFAARILVLGA